MPVRVKTATWLGEKFMGAQTWNGLIGECVSIPTETYHGVRDAADAAYFSIISGIDWHRVLLEAVSRHGALEDAGIHPTVRGGSLGTGTCPGCLEAALLAEDRLIGWIGDGVPAPTPPPPDVDDWPAALAAAVEHRTATA